MLTIFEKGGLIMWPLLAASVAAATVACERLLFVLKDRRARRPQDAQAVLAELQKGSPLRAAELGRASTDPVARALAEALGRASFSLAYQQQAARRLGAMARGLPVLDTIITLAPLLGLLGTVTGMIRSFGLLGGELDAPAAITGGIAEALIATAFGLIIAIVCLIPFNWLNALVEERQREFQDAGTAAELLGVGEKSGVAPRGEAVR
jgi:biopolymer transport protein ExbB